jgi:endogenous inhibitor of DNA gyrase (YacG/DUF329 family)
VSSPRRTDCPICGKLAASDLAPFCSQRCKEVDLGNWLGGVYRIPTAERAPGREANDSFELSEPSGVTEYEGEPN